MAAPATPEVRSPETRSRSGVMLGANVRRCAITTLVPFGDAVCVEAPSSQTGAIAGPPLVPRSGGDADEERFVSLRFEF